MIELLNKSLSPIRVVTGQILANKLLGVGSHTPTFSDAPGAFGRQWLFIFYHIYDVNPSFTSIGLFLDGDTSTYQDRTALNTADAGLSAISYTAAHAANNSTRNQIVFSWTGNALIAGGPLTYSILYRNV